MKTLKPLFTVTLIALLVLTACNLNKPARSPITTQTPTEKVTVKPSTRPVQAGPLSLAQLYETRVKSGDWTEGQGLVDLLGMYTGSAKADTILGNTDVLDFELTGVMQLARNYLADNPSGKVHDDLQRQVNLLEVPLDRLDLFSTKGNLSAHSSNLVALDKSSGSDQPLADTPNCQSLWADGFSSAAPVVCFQYAEQDADGTHIKFYYPNTWPSGDTRLARLEPILQAAVLAAQTYNALGADSLPTVKMVVTDLPGRDPRTHARSADLLAMADAVGTSPMQCYVGIFPSLFTVTVDQSQQALAHELFHCYQYQNLRAQEHGPDREAPDWWVEGSAEYFSNVVYPSVNYEHRWLPALPQLMLDQNLFGWSYKAFIFFQYLENRADTGIPGILRLLEAMPTGAGTGVSAQMEALSAYPGMASIFQGFGEAIADQSIMDSDGTVIALQIPFYPDDITEVTPGNILGRGPFAVDIHRVIFPQDFNYEVSTTITGNPGQVSARSEAGPAVWGPVPIRVSAGCIEAHYMVVVTQTGNTESNSYEVLLRSGSTPSTGTCSCLSGRWKMDDGSYMAHLNGLIAQVSGVTMVYTGVTGTDVIEFTPDGQVSQVIEDLSVSADMDVSGMPVQRLVVLMNGTTASAFAEVDGKLVYSGLDSQLTLTTTLNGASLGNSIPSDYLASGPLGTGAAYICNGDDLTLTPIYPHFTNLPPLSFSRE